MIPFLLKGLLRDRSRSLFPLMTVFAGVLLTVVLHAWLNGSISSLVLSTAHYTTGHLRVMTRAGTKEADEVPNDLALLGADSVLAGLRRSYADLRWSPRIRFGGLLDMPDERGETRAQEPVSGLAVDLFSAETPEWAVLNLREAIVRGRLPGKTGEILIGEDGAVKLGIRLGDTATIISSTMNGSMSVANFVVVGTVRFGVSAMDRGTVVADIGDVRRALDMDDGAGEILGFFRDDIYHEEQAGQIAGDFNRRHTGDGPFSPVMGTLRAQSGLADYLDYVGVYSGIIMGVFVLAMSVVLWNAGLTGSLRRYGEMGIRLALGEDKRHIYISLLAESLAIGVIGSVLGTAAGLAIAWYGQAKGLDLGSVLKGSTVMYPNVVRARITSLTFAVGFVPGLLATFIGAAISGAGIYRRQTSELFKELE